MAIGTDTLLATQDFTGADGSAYPAGWTERQGNWQIVGNALGIVTGEGLPVHAIYISPTRANDNYAVSFKMVSDISNGTLKGVMLRRTNGTGVTNTCYVLGPDDSGHACIWKLTNDVDELLVDGGYKGAWLNGTLTASAETVGNDVVLTLASSVDGTTVTYTDVEANSPLLSGDVGCLTTTNGSQMAFDDFTVLGTGTGGGGGTRKRRLLTVGAGH